MNEETNCELCHDGTSDEWECPSCCRKIVESRPEPRQDWDGDEEGFLLFKMMSGYEEEMAREEWTAKHSSSTAKKLASEYAKALIQHFKPPAKALDVQKVARIIELNLEDGDNYPTKKAFAEATAHTICAKFSLVKVVWPKKIDETDYLLMEEDNPELNKMIGWNTCLAEFKRLNLDVEERKKVKWPEKAFCKEHPENDHTCVECAINRRGNTMIFACIQAHNEAMKE